MSFLRKQRRQDLIFVRDAMRPFVALTVRGLSLSTALTSSPVIIVRIPVIDSLGDEFLSYVKDGMKITVKPDGIVEVEDKYKEKSQDLRKSWDFLRQN